MPDLTTKEALLERMVEATEKLATDVPAKFDEYLQLSGGVMKGTIVGAEQLSLSANSGTSTKELLGKPDGTLTWDGKSIPERAYGLTFAGDSQPYTFAMGSYSAIIFARRGNNCAVFMVTYWDEGAMKIFSSGNDPITISHSANSNEVTVTNVNNNYITVKIINGGAL